MKVKKFLLKDNVDGGYTDLITFKEEVELEDIKNVVGNVKKAFPTSYTNENIYQALDELGSYELLSLFDIPIVEY